MQTHAESIRQRLLGVELSPDDAAELIRTIHTRVRYHWPGRFDNPTKTVIKSPSGPRGRTK